MMNAIFRWSLSVLVPTTNCVCDDLEPISEPGFNGQSVARSPDDEKKLVWAKVCF